MKTKIIELEHIKTVSTTITLEVPADTTTEKLEEIKSALHDDCELKEHVIDYVAEDRGSYDTEHEYNLSETHVAYSMATDPPTRDEWPVKEGDGTVHISLEDEAYREALVADEIFTEEELSPAE